MYHLTKLHVSAFTRFTNYVYLFTQAKFPKLLGEIRGEGLLWGIEILQDSLPAPTLTKKLVSQLSSESKILVGVTGKHKHILLFTPPMCFTVDNAKRYRCISLWRDGSAMKFKRRLNDGLDRMVCSNTLCGGMVCIKRRGKSALSKMQTFL